MQNPESFCLQLRLGAIKLISMPTDYVPRRIDWTKWIDGVSAGMQCQSSRQAASPRVWMSPDHLETKDNLAMMSVSGQRGLEQIDLLNQFSDIAESTKFLFVGSWPAQMPSWFNSVQSVYHSFYGSKVYEVLERQLFLWNMMADKLETNASFLVTDDIGRLSSLSGLSKSWRSRQIRSGVNSEARASSWFASTVDVFSPTTLHGELLRLHRIAVIEPENWCGSPQINQDFLGQISKPNKAPEIWVSSPGIGLCLWIAEHQEPLDSCIAKIRIPSAVLGWNPVRDALSFLSEAPSQSVLYLVDQYARLQILIKELE